MLRSGTYIHPQGKLHIHYQSRRIFSATAICNPCLVGRSPGWMTSSDDQYSVRCFLLIYERSGRRGIIDEFICAFPMYSIVFNNFAMAVLIQNHGYG